ncbi:AbrB family transcriptional regulator [Cereibacter changlensis JA139]|uniref:AbrB family transcriptional regulator n=3 Tax=Cereibacter changlensis TaxID=402884 RepID=A0A2T4JQF1_9RHOB|nr:AbrB family transcriptional regulator [Cereibacter changlensis JA139]PZX56245.1 AbrB family looped-hinge helix DNA binding protein [Cereibacter changlensis]
MPESTLTSKGQTTLPAEVRRALDLAPGDRLRYVILDGGEVRLVKTRAVAGIAGMLHRAHRAPVDLGAMDEAIAGGAGE